MRKTKKTLSALAAVMVATSATGLNIPLRQSTENGILTSYAEDENKTPEYKTTESGFVYYVNDGGTITIASGPKGEEHSYIPAKINNIFVTEIGDKAFENYEKLERVDIPETIIKIGNYAFGYCKNLQYLQLPDTVTTLGDGIIAGCEKITALSIPNSVTSAEFALSHSYIRELTFEEGRTIIPSAIAAACHELYNVYLPDSIEYIDFYAFGECYKLGRISDNGSFKFHRDAFSGCYSLFNSYHHERLNVLDPWNCSLKITDTSSLALNNTIEYTCKYKIKPEFYDNGVLMTINLNLSKEMKFPENISNAKNADDIYWISSTNTDIHSIYSIENTAIFDVSEPEGEITFNVVVPEDMELCEAEAILSIEKNEFRHKIGHTSDKLSKITVSSSEYVNEFNTDIHGYAEEGQSVEIYVNDKLAGTVKSNESTGRYSGNISLPEGDNGTTYSIYTKCGEDISDTITVEYNNTKPIITNVALHYDKNKTENVSDAFYNGKSPVISYNPNYPLEFEINVTNNDKIKSIYITSRKANETRYLKANYNERTGTWITEGSWLDDDMQPIDDPEYVPGLLNISIITANDPTVGRPFFANLDLYEQFQKDAKIRFVIKPSGYVYEAVKGNPVEDATMTVYYFDSESGKSVKWNAKDYDQINPLSSDFEGKYAWDVPVGKWKVVCEKEGYETQESEWFDVPPIRTEVNFSLVSKETPKVLKAVTNDNGIEVKFSKFIDIKTVTTSSLKLDGFSGTYTIEPQLLNKNDAYADTFVIKGNFTDVESLSVTKTILSYAGVPVEDTTISLRRIPGDLNGDGNVNIADAVILQRILLGAEELEDWQILDVFRDNSIDIYDLLAILDIVTHQ